MKIDFNELKRALAKNKVYDAWQYVESLQEILDYMRSSYSLIFKVYNRSINTLKEVEQDVLKQAFETGKASFTTNDLNYTNLNISGYEIDDDVFIRKTVMEFFHYGRVSMDILFQIINAALLGDEAYSVEDRYLIKNLLIKLSGEPNFSTLLQMMNTNKNDTRYQYLMAFDNYVKHIKTVLITIKTSILVGNNNVFQLNAFSYRNVNYPEENALDKIKEIHDYVLNMIDDILNEILVQIPNCLSNDQRIQEIHYKLVFGEHEGKTCTEYISFFIDVSNNLAELPTEIKVYPLLISSNNDIYSFDFKFDRIFIRKAGSDETDIVGMATLKNGTATNEFYRIFEIKPCNQSDYNMYIADFKTSYSGIRLSMNLRAMNGVLIFAHNNN